jgi:hyperosmotically inducible periplasmic protein
MLKTGLSAGLSTGLSLAVALALTACSKPEQPIPLKPKPQAEAPAAPAAATPTPAPAVAKAEEPKDPNKELAQRVRRALEGTAKVQGAAIDVTAADGKVTLWGTAASADERSRAAQAAAKVDGVKSVENKIAVVKGS